MYINPANSHKSLLTSNQILLPVPSIMTDRAPKTNAIGVIISQKIPRFLTDLFFTSSNQINCRNKSGLNRYLVGRLLDFYLQTYLNNLANVIAIKIASLSIGVGCWFTGSNWHNCKLSWYRSIQRSRGSLIDPHQHPSPGCAYAYSLIQKRR